MYDVVRKKTIDAKTIEFACINDEQEAKLFAHLDEEINKSNNNHSNATPISQHLLKLLLFPFLLPLSSTTTISSGSALQFARIEMKVVAIAQDIFTPPPQLI
jgi:hypothetical protein